MQTTVTALQTRVALLDQGQIMEADVRLKVPLQGSHQTLSAVLCVGRRRVHSGRVAGETMNTGTI